MLKILIGESSKFYNRKNLIQNNNKEKICTDEDVSS